MDMMRIRRQILLQSPAYEAWNLSFDGSTYINTGVYLFTDLSKDFELLLNYYTPDGEIGSQGTIVCSKAEQTSYPGFVFRRKQNDPNHTQLEISGSSIYRYPFVDCINKDITFKRVNGTYTVRFGNGNPISINVRAMTHNIPVTLGAVLKPDGTLMRYGTNFTINHIRIKWL